MTDLPTQMNCVEMTETGGPEVLTMGSRPLPTLRAGEVLIKVAAAGVNRPDVIQRQGFYPAPKGESDILGLEVAGTVVAVAEDVENLKVGDQVCALLAGGGYAEYAAAPAAQCLPIPAGLDMVQAAALPETFFTVWYNLFDRCELKEGETLLVHGGSSGIGTTAIQMASALGVKVYATAGSPEKVAACEKLGATKAINYREDDFEEVLKELEPKGIDVILDMVGGPYIQKNINTLAADGRLANIAYLKGPKAEINFMRVMLKRLTITGSTLRIQPVPVKRLIGISLQASVWPLIETGKISPVIDSTFALNEVKAAHERIDSGNHIGKIVLTV